MTISADDIREFCAYLRGCSDAQLRAVFDKETKAGRDEYVALVDAEAAHRCLFFLPER